MHPVRLPLVLGLVALASVSCGGDGPSPVRPTPTPQTGTLTLSGTVSETAPTASARIAGAKITIMDGPNVGRSTTSDASGVFQLTGLQAGDFSVWTQAANYVEHLQRFAFTSDQAVTFGLDPVFQMVATTENGSINGGGAACHGVYDDPILQDSPCKARYSFNVHHDGMLTAEVISSDPETTFLLHLVRVVDGKVIGPAVQLWQPTAVSAHTQYIVQVTKFGLYEDAPPEKVTPFSLTVRRPN